MSLDILPPDSEAGYRTRALRLCLESDVRLFLRNCENVCISSSTVAFNVAGRLKSYRANMEGQVFLGLVYFDGLTGWLLVFRGVIFYCSYSSSLSLLVYKLVPTLLQLGVDGVPGAVLGWGMFPSACFFV